MIDLRKDEYFIDALNKCLMENLIKGAIDRELVDVSFLRAIGKTTALVEFANKANIPVVVNNDGQKLYILDNFKMDVSIYTTSELRGLEKTKVVVEEGVSKEEVELLGHIVVTGLYTKNK